MLEWVAIWQHCPLSGVLTWGNVHRRRHLPKCPQLFNPFNFDRIQWWHWAVIKPTQPSVPWTSLLHFFSVWIFCLCIFIFTKIRWKKSTQIWQGADLIGHLIKCVLAVSWETWATQRIWPPGLFPKLTIQLGRWDRWNNSSIHSANTCSMTSRFLGWRPGAHRPLL